MLGFLEKRQKWKLNCTIHMTYEGKENKAISCAEECFLIGSEKTEQYTSPTTSVY